MPPCPFGDLGVANSSRVFHDETIRFGIDMCNETRLLLNKYLVMLEGYETLTTYPRVLQLELRVHIRWIIVSVQLILLFFHEEVMGIAKIGSKSFCIFTCSD